LAYPGNRRFSIGYDGADGPAYLQSRGLNSDVILEPALVAKLPGLGQSAADLANASKAVQIAEANQRSLHHSYDRGTLPSPQIPAASYDVDAVQ